MSFLEDWEIKGYSSSRVTLMTPLPNGGFYGERGVKEFVERYGHRVENNRDMYFAGNHRVGVIYDKTQLTMQITGFDPNSPRKLE